MCSIIIHFQNFFQCELLNIRIAIMEKLKKKNNINDCNRITTLKNRLQCNTDVHNSTLSASTLTSLNGITDNNVYYSSEHEQYSSLQFLFISTCTSSYWARLPVFSSECIPHFDSLHLHMRKHLLFLLKIQLEVCGDNRLKLHFFWRSK